VTETSLKRRRIVVQLGGYHPIPPDEAHAKASRDFARFLAVWHLSGTVAPGARQTTSQVQWAVTLAGPDWQTEASHRIFRWDDLITTERKRSWLTRFPLGITSLFDFAAHGALVRYVGSAWRYALFFLYPAILLTIIAAAAWFVTGFIPGIGTPLRALAAMVTFAILLPFIGNRLYLDHLLDDWIHAAALVRQPTPEVETRLDELADELAPQEGELLIIGHSLGAVLGLHLIAKLLDRGYTRPVRFASVGSSVLKIGFHRKAVRLRGDAARAAESGQVLWVDFQALNDVMNFYKSEPVAALGINAPPAHTRTVRFRSMVRPDRYRRLERNFFRLHNQFVNANDFRANYDMQMMAFGPFTLETLTESPDGAMSMLDDNGGLTEAGRMALQSQATSRAKP